MHGPTFRNARSANGGHRQYPDDFRNQKSASLSQSRPCIPGRRPSPAYCHPGITQRERRPSQDALTPNTAHGGHPDSRGAPVVTTITSSMLHPLVAWMSRSLLALGHSEPVGRSRCSPCINGLPAAPERRARPRAVGGCHAHSPTCAPALVLVQGRESGRYPPDQSRRGTRRQHGLDRRIGRCAVRRSRSSSM